MRRSLYQSLSVFSLTLISISTALYANTCPEEITRRDVQAFLKDPNGYIEIQGRPYLLANPRADIQNLPTHQATLVRQKIKLDREKSDENLGLCQYSYRGYASKHLFSFGLKGPYKKTINFPPEEQIPTYEIGYLDLGNSPHTMHDEKGRLMIQSVYIRSDQQRPNFLQGPEGKAHRSVLLYFVKEPSGYLYLINPKFALESDQQGREFKLNMMNTLKVMFTTDLNGKEVSFKKTGQYVALKNLKTKILEIVPTVELTLPQS